MSWNNYPAEKVETIPGVCRASVTQMVHRHRLLYAHPELTFEVNIGEEEEPLLETIAQEMKQADMLTGCRMNEPLCPPYDLESRRSLKFWSIPRTRVNWSGPCQ